MVSAIRCTAAAVVVLSLTFSSAAAASDYYYEGPAMCYGAGERCMGEKGYPAVDYMPCCDGLKQTTVEYHWGTFCGAPPKPMKCAGAVGKPYVEYVECGEGYHCTEPEGYGSWYDWGKYCMPSGADHYAAKCYKDGERQSGEKGYDAVAWMPCCSGMESVTMYDSYGKKMWGKFCPYKYEAAAEPAEPYYKAPMAKKPVVAEPYYKAPAPTAEPYY